MEIKILGIPRNYTRKEAVQELENAYYTRTLDNLEVLLMVREIIEECEAEVKEALEESAGYYETICDECGKVIYD